MSNTSHAPKWDLPPGGQPDSPIRYRLSCICGQWTYDELVGRPTEEDSREALVAFWRHEHNAPDHVGPQPGAS
jgi:hypothetical protein